MSKFYETSPIRFHTSHFSSFSTELSAWIDLKLRGTLIPNSFEKTLPTCKMNTGRQLDGEKLGLGWLIDEITKIQSRKIGNVINRKS